MSREMTQSSRQEIEKVKNWLNLQDPITIATHQFVDADAAFSAALLRVLRPRAGLIFTRADSEITDERCLAVDLSEGPRAVKGLDEGSAFGLIVLAMRDIDAPVYSALRRWAFQLNKTDSGKMCNDSVMLGEFVNSWRSLKFDDGQIVAKIEELIKGKLNHEKRNLQQEETAQSVDMEDGIAIISGDIRVKASHLFKMGALAVVRQSSCGQVVIISNKLQRQDISLSELKEILPSSWFIHPSGFMACFGSVKAPKNYQDSGLEFDDLTTIVKTWINSHIEDLTKQGIKLGK